MNLNKIEQRFFDDVLQVELDTPINATLKVHDDEFHVVAIPQLSKAPTSYFATLGRQHILPRTKMARSH